VCGWDGWLCLATAAKTKLAPEDVEIDFFIEKRGPAKFWRGFFNALQRPAFNASSFWVGAIFQSDPKRQRGQSVKTGEVQAAGKATLALQALCRSETEQLAHHEPQVARHRRHQVPLLYL